MSEADSHGVQTTQSLTETQRQTETRPSIAKTQQKKEETFLLACNALMSSSQPETEAETGAND